MTDSRNWRRISSAQNELVKETRRAFSRAELTTDGHCAIESVRTLDEALRSGLHFKAILVAESAQNRAEPLLPQISKRTELLLLPDKVFTGMVATETPQGIAALVKIRERKLEDILRLKSPLLMVAAGVQDPGNLGTIIRSAEAFGASALLATEGTVSQYNSKVVRASAGSLFRLPVFRVELQKAIADLHEYGAILMATSAHGGTPLDSAVLTRPLALLIGSEGAGLPRKILQQADETVRIPYAHRVESLNAAIAASIVLYEAARQRAAQPIVAQPSSETSPSG